MTPPPDTFSCLPVIDESILVTVELTLDASYLMIKLALAVISEILRSLRPLCIGSLILTLSPDIDNIFI